jgi:hypothetical protein
MPGGSFLGALISGYLTDKLGRRRAIQVGCAIWIIGSIISCASQSIGMLIAGRFINGLSVGICSAQVPVYVTELAPPSKRGRVVGSQQWVKSTILLHSTCSDKPPGNYMGYPHYVLHLLRLHIPRGRESLPCAMGHPDASSRYPRYRSHLPARISKVRSSLDLIA